MHVNIEHDDRKSDVKRRISHATGIPVTDVKVVLASPTQIAAGSKRCPGLSPRTAGAMEKLGQRRAYRRETEINRSCRD